MNTSKLIPWGQHNLDTKAKDSTRNKNYRPLSLIYTEAKFFNKILANQIQKHIKKIKHDDQVRFVPGMHG